MLKIKLFAASFFVAIFSALAQADLLTLEGVDATENFNAAANNYEAFSGGSMGSERREFSLYSGTVSSDKKSSASITSWVAFKLNAPLFAGNSAVVMDNGLRKDVVQAETASNAIYVDTNFKEVSEISFSGGKYFPEESFIFTKTISNVPDPSSFFLLGVGILALAAVRRKFSA